MSINMRPFKVDSAQEAMFRDLSALIRRNTKDIGPLEMIALISNMLGTVIACSNFTKEDEKVLNALIEKNMEFGYESSKREQEEWGDAN